MNTGVIVATHHHKHCLVKNDKLRMSESAARSHDPTMPMSEIERENDVDMRSLDGLTISSKR